MVRIEKKFFWLRFWKKMYIVQVNLHQAKWIHFYIKLLLKILYQDMFFLFPWFELVYRKTNHISCSTLFSDPICVKMAYNCKCTFETSKLCDGLQFIKKRTIFLFYFENELHWHSWTLTSIELEYSQ